MQQYLLFLSLLPEPDVVCPCLFVPDVDQERYYEQDCPSEHPFLGGAEQQVRGCCPQVHCP